MASGINMKLFLKLIFPLFALIFWGLSLSFTKPVYAENITRVEVLHAYLEKYSSPLENNAEDFVEAADKYNLDWRLVTAISGVESTFGKFVPGGTDSKYSSYNGWGWGVYGTQAIYFKSWKEGIYTVSEGLRKNYFDKGYTNPHTLNKIYAASPAWGAKVSYFLEDIRKFQELYEKENFNIGNLDLQPEIAGASATPSSI